MQSITKDYLLPILCSPNDSEIRPGDSVRLTLTDSIPGLPSPIVAVVQNPIDRVAMIHPTTGCRVSGYRYTFRYDEAQLDGVVTAIDACDIVSVACVTCCELLQEALDAEEAARIASDQALSDSLDAETEARISGDAGLEEQLDLEENARQEQDAALMAALTPGVLVPTNLAPSTGSVIFASPPTIGSTVTIGSQVYTFTDDVTLDDLPYRVLIGATAYDSIVNLDAAINDSGTPGTQYGTGTGANEDVTSIASIFTTGVDLTSIESGVSANGIPLAATVVGATVSAATMTGGTDMTPAPPYFHIQGGNLYSHADGLWYQSAVTLVS